MAAVLLTCSLSGCALADTNMNAALERSLAEAETVSLPAANYHKRYYSYYAQPCIGRISAADTGNVFSYEGKLFVMNLNIPRILSEEGSSAGPVLSGGSREAYYERVCQNRKGEDMNYSLTVSELGNRHYISMQTDLMQFYAVSDITSVPRLAAEMLRIARSVSVDRTAVTAAFSSSDEIIYAGEAIELFDSITPENGSIEELFPEPVASEEFNQTDTGTAEQSQTNGGKN